MTFLNPTALWLFLVLIPAALIYFLKIKPERRVTTVLFLWDKVFKEKRSSSLFQKLRDILSMLLILAALSMIVMALAKPVIYQSELHADKLIIIIDNSASMSAKFSDEKTFFDIAKKQVEKIIKNASVFKSVMLLSVSNDINIICNNTDDIKILLDSLKKLTVSQMPLSSGRLIQMINFLRNEYHINKSCSLSETGKKKQTDNNRKLKKTKIIFITDGCFKGAKRLNSFKNIDIIKIEKKREYVKNIGIVKFDLKRLNPNSDTIYLFCQFASSLRKPIETSLIIAHEKKRNIVKLYSVKISPGLNTPRIFTVRSPLCGKWIVYLDYKDEFELDNTTYGVISRNLPIEVKVFANSSDAKFFKACVRAFENSYTRLRLVSDISKVNIALCTRNEKTIENCLTSNTTGIKKISYIIFNPSGNSVFWEKIGKIISPSIAIIKYPSHPAIRFSNFKTVVFRGAKHIIPPANSLILAVTPENIPLIYITGQKGHKAVVVNMDPYLSDFFLNLNFPVFIYSVADYLAEKRHLIRSILKTGDTLPFPGSIQTFTVKKLDKNIKEWTDVSSFLFPYIGFYQIVPSPFNSIHSKVKIFEKKIMVGCSLLSTADSLMDNSQIKNSSLKIAKGYAPANILFAMAIMILALECILYHQRKVG